MPSPIVTQLITTASQLAQQSGIAHLVLAVRDPITGESMVVASPGALDDLRAVLELKLAGGGVAAWE